MNSAVLPEPHELPNYPAACFMEQKKVRVLTQDQKNEVQPEQGSEAALPCHHKRECISIRTLYNPLQLCKKVVIRTSYFSVMAFVYFERMNRQHVLLFSETDSGLHNQRISDFTTFF
jgi:hypothetical protein